MRNVHLLCIATESIYAEVILAFKQFFRFRNFNFTYEWAFKKEPDMDFSHDINIVIKAQREFDPKRLPKQSTKILFQSEQFSKLRQFNSLPYVEGWDLILDVFKENVDTAKQYKTTAIIKFFPIGYHQAYNWNQYPEFVEDNLTDNDFYFFGARTEYRTKYWNEKILPLSSSSRFANTDNGRIKYQQIVHSKINIFIPAWEPYYFPSMRAMQILANKKFFVVVSDTPQDYTPFIPGRHFALVSSDNSEKELKRYLHDEEFRSRFVGKMYEDIFINHRFENYLKNAISEVL